MSSLHAVDFVDSNNKPLEGLVSVREPSKADSPDERAVLIQAKEFKYIDYVYFRRFKDSAGNIVRSSQVAAYVIDNSHGKLTKDELATLHHKLWLHAVSPLVYVAWPTQVDILSCARKADFWDDTGDVPSEHYSPAVTIKVAADISDELAKRKRLRCSAFRLADGTFWDEPENQKLASDDKAAHRSLIQAIVEADRELGGSKKHLRRRLLVLMVLIKYLEDRGVFPKELFGRFHKGARSFLEILKTGAVEKVTRLLSYLEQRFNGDVFSLGTSEKLSKTELTQFVTLVEGKTLGGQKYFWELFDFAQIPVEVISRLYQRFVTGHGAVYTPPFLAALLLDQVMPFDSMTGKEKVLDPACGSGVFLVGAFKRLVTHWRSQHQWKKPSVDDLKAILSRSIHGIEMETVAVDLTAFSLALAICDALAPHVIWNQLKFDKLRGRNLRVGDFFKPITVASTHEHSWPSTFDVVVGNPPFESKSSKLTPAALAIEAARPSTEPKLPQQEVAYLFLEQCIHQLSPNGSICLIQPHGLIYNSNPAAFRTHLMKLARLKTVLDFVSIRGLYGKDAKTIAWHAIKDKNRKADVAHLTFRRTFSTSQGTSFEIDHYDYHTVPYSDASNSPFAWRIGLLGGGRLAELSARLRMRTLQQYVESKSGWLYSEGFKLGQNKKSSKLTGQLHLPTGALTVTGIDESRLYPLRQQLFEATRDEMLYEPPITVIREHWSLPVAFWDKCHLNFMRSIVGIHAPNTDYDELRALTNTLQDHRRLFQFCMALNGTRFLTGRATSVNKIDIDRLPMPDNLRNLDLAFWEEAIKEDVLNYMADYVRLGQDSKLLKQQANTNDIREFAAFYLRMLGSLYRNLKAGEHIKLNGLIAQPFYFGKTPNVSWLGDNCEDALRRLVYDETGEALRTVRVVRYYEENVILIVKPDRLRYWIKSTAIRDADDTLIELREQGW